MNIYKFSHVIDFLKEYNADQVYRNKREYYFRTKYPALYAEILFATSFLTNPSFIERLYCFTNDIKSRPVCICGNEVTFSKESYHGKERRYHSYCSQRCSMFDMKTLIGVENASQLASVVQKKKDSALKKFGVDNVSKAESVKQVLADKKRAYWDDVYTRKQFTSSGLTRKQYKHRAQQYATTQYNRYKDLLDPFGIRGRDWHIDHVYSLTDGFINDVPINIISHVSNLCLISAKDNYAKNKFSHKSLEELHDDFISFHRNKQKCQTVGQSCWTHG